MAASDGVLRNLGILDGFSAVDARLTRRINLNEKLVTEIFFEGFNLLNTVTFSRATLAVVLADGIKQDNGRLKVPNRIYFATFATHLFQIGFRFSF